VAFSVTILGSSSALPTSHRIPTAHLVNHDERFFLIDCAEGTQAQMRRFRANFNRINHIFISHLHGDHILGLPGFLSTLALLGRKAEMHIYAPASLENYLKTGFQLMASEPPYSIIFHPHNEKEFTLIYEDKKLEIYSFPLRHRIACSGFLFKEKPKMLNLQKDAVAHYDIPVHWRNRIKNGEDFVREDGKVFANKLLTVPAAQPLSYAFCTDTLYMPSLTKYLQNVDVLYHEATFLDADLKLARSTMHSTAKQAAELAVKLNAAKLIIGHYSSRYLKLDDFLTEAKSVFVNTALATEGDIHTIAR
jgi:ribonuclease Z